MLFRRKNKDVVAAEAPATPVSGAEIEVVRERCREMVRKRALVSAGVAAVPLPGLDVLSDLSTFTLLVEEVNKEFGLSQKQIERLHPRLRVLAYQAAASVGGMLVGKLVTKRLVLVLFKRAGVKIAAKTVAKVVPIAGQVASAAIGFALFRKMGYQHVEACAKVARELQKLQVIDAGTAQADKQMPA
ncbi:hypothetical protein [Massilia alkalitolerans]|jgi:hypothetical protein|uniref:hypothetical protein n=1 Tax=Massilia alkalitolerans TaxID=286638 RepID=UPI00040690AE|nr:hypothetical protein [Massilia alkalitolerans]